MNNKYEDEKDNECPYVLAGLIAIVIICISLFIGYKVALMFNLIKGIITFFLSCLLMITILVSILYYRN